MSEIQAKNSFGEIHLSQGIDWAFHSLSHYPLLVYNLDKKTPEGVYAGCVGLRKNYVGWQWKVE